MLNDLIYKNQWSIKGSDPNCQLSDSLLSILCKVFWNDLCSTSNMFGKWDFDFSKVEMFWDCSIDEEHE